MSAAIVKAADIAPQAFRPAAADALDKEDDLQYDVGHLAAFDYHPADLKSVDSSKERALTSRGRDAIQLLMNRVFDLSTEASAWGPIAKLPEPTLRLPREKPVPKPKPLTRWQKFAQERGIKAKKRDRMAWDEEAQEWRPVWGYKRAGGDDADPWLIELKSTDTADADKFEERAVAKQQRVLKNRMQQIKNLDRAEMETGGRKRRAGAPAPGAPAGLPVELTDHGEQLGGRAKRRRGMAGTAAALKLAQQSTASMGKFDPMLQGEPRPKSVSKPRLLTRAAKGEVERSKEILHSVLNKTDKPPPGAQRMSGVDAETEKRILAPKKGKGGKGGKGKAGGRGNHGKAGGPKAGGPKAGGKKGGGKKAGGSKAGGKKGGGGGKRAGPKARA